MTRRIRNAANVVVWFAAELVENLWLKKQRDRLGISALERVVYECEDRISELERGQVKR